MPRLLAEVSHDPELHAIFTAQLVEPRRAGGADRARAGARPRRDARGRRPRAGHRHARRADHLPLHHHRRRPRARPPRRRRACSTPLLERPQATCTRPLTTPRLAVAGQQLEQLGADQLAAPAAQRADVGLGLGTAGGDDDRREVGARGDQLVGQPGLLRPRAHQRLGQRDRRAVDGVGREPLALLEADRLGGAAALDRGEDVAGAAADDVRARRRGSAPAPSRCAAPRLASSTSVGSRTTEPTGRSSAAAVRSRQAASSRAIARSRGVEARDARQPPPDLLGSRSSVASAITRHSSRAHSSRPRSASRRCSSSASGSRCSTSSRA